MKMRIRPRGSQTVGEIITKAFDLYTPRFMTHLFIVAQMSDGTIVSTTPDDIFEEEPVHLWHVTCRFFNLFGKPVLPRYEVFPQFPPPPRL